MACLLNMFICIPDDPVEDDPRFGNQTEWKIGMKDAPGYSPGNCLFGCICQPCALYDLRKKALGGSLEEYTCCQGYIWPMSSRAGQCGEKSSPECCLCLEACFCAGCSMSATRFLVMDAKNIKSDPCDNRIIRFNNWLQLISCVCQILALFDETFRDAADIIRLIAELVFCITMGCMTAQLYYEMDESKGPFAKAGHGAPDVQTMKV
mmetsp:Transcript_14861/g.16809  ORF Transcript_14861/g.16809 Transcript_14861/m.16809 type:complete len:207 (+) Transcript_14861:253-873(+)|eukprot:CAMPEP_0184008406 /NCGR_PEP_ID=MMETSP0954-20121128/1955_1 /TAXON_ID=627963 /ORGANISM="Aplanochytrium sp, Strain PBS07" /LENGTH=206 /DNA_ID=CAMNT_0026287511 /DNA_START=254 /DNA_END=874 /DNA_ORIENTATION=+